MSDYLYQRGKKGNWQLRMPIPRQLSNGRARTRNKSLGTSDRRIAEKRALPIRQQWEREFSLLQSGDIMQSSAAVDIATFTYDYVYNQVLDKLDKVRQAGGSAEDLINKRRKEIREQSANLADGKTEIYEAVVDKFIEKNGLDVPKNSIVYDEHVKAAAEATIDAMVVWTDKLEGNFQAEPTSRSVINAREEIVSRAVPGESLLDLFEKWAEERLAKNEKRQDTVDQDRKVIIQFADFVGKDRSIRSIMPKDVSDYRDTLRDLPPKWGSKRELMNLKMRDAAKKARELSLPQTAFTTVNKHLSTISPLFKWVARKPQFAGLANPTDGLFHDKVKGKNRRPALPTQTLNTILGSPLFSGFECDGKEHRKGEILADDWRKWIPLIALFTGARIGEIAQLRICDIQMEEDYPYFIVVHDPKAGLFTKNGKSRVMGMHSKLKDLGFLDFVERRKQASPNDLTARLFNNLAPSSRGQIGAVPSRWWRNYLSQIGVKSGNDGLGAHSFRHELADRLRNEANLIDSQVAICLGHSIETTTSGYGTVRQGTAKMLNEWIESVRWNGVDFSKIAPFNKP